MSRLSLEICLEYSLLNNFPLMIIGSRNQVDYNTGYAFTTENLVEFIKSHKFYNSSNILICRDHCGPYFSDKDKGLGLDKTVDQCLSTIKADLTNNFDLIHIDVSRVNPHRQLEIASKLFEFSLNINDKVMFEFGTEDNNGLIENVNSLNSQFVFLKQYYPYVKYFVSQTGSLTKHKQVGTFNKNLVLNLTNMVHQENLLFKEHNADYLRIDDVRLRKQANVDALNIAPQIGYLHSQSLYNIGKDLPEFKLFFDFVLTQKYYDKWVTSDVNDDLIKFLSSGHYFFNSDLGKKLHSKINETQLYEDLRIRINCALDEYRLGFLN